MYKCIILIIVAVLGLADFSNAAQKKCTQDEAIRAESSTDSLRDWSSVYKSYNKYHHCDDGSISEGYSEKICLLLANDWKHIPDLNNLIHNNKNFRNFIVKHIDDTVRVTDVRKIFNNATESCPNGVETLCKSITMKICELEKEINGFKAVTKSSILNQVQIDKFCK